MATKLFKGRKVTNIVTGATGIVKAVWFNEFSQQYVVNVRCGGLTVSWNAVSVTGLV